MRKPNNPSPRIRKGLLDTAPETLAQGTFGSDYVPQDPNRPTQIGYSGNYEPVVNPNWTPALTANDRNYENYNGGIRRTDLPGQFRASTPSAAEILANPELYGASPEWIAAQQPPQTTQPPPQDGPPATTMPVPGSPPPGGGLPPSNQNPRGPGNLTPPPNLPTPGAGQNPFPGQVAPGGRDGLPIDTGGGGRGGGTPIPPGVLGMDNVLAAYGMMRGPNGEIMPIMLKQGRSPYQNGGGMSAMPGFSLPPGATSLLGNHTGGYTDTTNPGRNGLL